MTLQQYYNQVSQRIDNVQFENVWPGFEPCKFALYNDTQCYYNDQHIDKTDVFVANTAIEYNGEYIAIWEIESELICLDSLTACIIHEMWHAHQFTMGESRWANEMHALQHYQYDAQAISIKLHEATLMCEILAGNKGAYEQLLLTRASRQKLFGYQYNYEAKVEQIEGSALYIELMVLKQLNTPKYNDRLNRALAQITDPCRYLPIRTACYTVGALLLMCIKKCSNFDYTTFTSTPFSVAILKDICPITTKIAANSDISQCIKQYHHTTQDIINRAVSDSNVVLQGDYTLVGINIWDARQLGNYVTSSYFVAYQDNNETKVLNGNFVVLMHDNGNISKIYQLT